MSELMESSSNVNQQVEQPKEKTTTLCTESPEKENQESFRQQKQKFLQKMTQDVPKRVKKGEIKDLINISKSTIHFGSVISGNICEDDLQFYNNSQETLIVCVQVMCNNSEYDELDEYVYSARKLSGYDYNDKFMLACPAQKAFSLKVALKVPNTFEIKTILGTVQINAQYSNHSKVAGSLTVKVSSTITQPIVDCPKTLLCSTYNVAVIQLAFKLGKKLDCKIPFRNNSSIMLPMEVDLLNKNGEVQATPGQLQVQSNSQFLVTILVKSKQEQLIKNVLIMKVKNSNVHFSFPIVIKVY